MILSLCLPSLLASVREQWGLKVEGGTGFYSWELFNLDQEIGEYLDQLGVLTLECLVEEERGWGGRERERERVGADPCEKMHLIKEVSSFQRVVCTEFNRVGTWRCVPISFQKVKDVVTDLTFSSSHQLHSQIFCDCLPEISQKMMSCSLKWTENVNWQQLSWAIFVFRVYLELWPKFTIPNNMLCCLAFPSISLIG